VNKRKSLSSLRTSKGLVILGFLAMVAIAGYVNYKSNHKYPKLSVASSVSASSIQVAATSPYAGWDSFKTVENVSLMYPKSWDIRDKTANLGSGVYLTMTATDKSVLTLKSVASKPNQVVGKIVMTAPITFENHSDYLLYGGSPKASNPKNISIMTLSRSSSAYLAPHSFSNAFWLMTYTTPRPTTLYGVANSTYFQDAVLLLESIKS
jgi:hypothetical protein